MMSRAPQAAKTLGIPATYDLRYRISAAVVTDHKRLARAARRIDQINSKQDAHGDAALPTGREVRALVHCETQQQLLCFYPCQDIS